MFINCYSKFDDIFFYQKLYHIFILNDADKFNLNFCVIFYFKTTNHEPVRFLTKNCFILFIIQHFRY